MLDGIFALSSAEPLIAGASRHERERLGAEKLNVDSSVTICVFALVAQEWKDGLVFFQICMYCMREPWIRR